MYHKGIAAAAIPLLPHAHPLGHCFAVPFMYPLFQLLTLAAEDNLTDEAVCNRT